MTASPPPATLERAAMKILKNIRVVEMGTYITGPAAAMLLGDLGADVIKVERPETGDPFRAFKGGLYSPHYQTYNRNKRSIALDTAKPGDRSLFHDLIASADIFIQNFRPGVAERLGAGNRQVQLSCWTTSGFVVIADGVRWVRQ
jgi:crotonobetainyl-CoA:carnitine CoA-transferase CaiB-like acyl-CoA transferase